MGVVHFVKVVILVFEYCGNQRLFIVNFLVRAKCAEIRCEIEILIYKWKGKKNKWQERESRKST